MTSFEDRGTARQQAARLTPIAGDEASLDEVIMFVHIKACGPDSDRHDPFCNTMRLLAEDWRHLTHPSTPPKGAPF